MTEKFDPVMMRIEELAEELIKRSRKKLATVDALRELLREASDALDTLIDSWGSAVEIDGYLRRSSLSMAPISSANLRRIVELHAKIKETLE